MFATISNLLSIALSAKDVHDVLLWRYRSEKLSMYGWSEYVQRNDANMSKTQNIVRHTDTETDTPQSITKHTNMPNQRILRTFYSIDWQCTAAAAAVVVVPRSRCDTKINSQLLSCCFFLLLCRRPSLAGSLKSLDVCSRVYLNLLEQANIVQQQRRAINKEWRMSASVLCLRT